MKIEMHISWNINWKEGRRVVEIAEYDLEQTISTYSDQQKKFANLGSSQSNQSFNNSIASKAPKEMQFFGSVSTTFRVATASVQKNLESNNVLKVSLKLFIGIWHYNWKGLYNTCFTWIKNIIHYFIYYALNLSKGRWWTVVVTGRAHKESISLTWFEKDKGLWTEVINSIQGEKVTIEI